MIRVLPFIGVPSSCLIDPILCTLQMEEIPDFSLDEDDEARRKDPDVLTHLRVPRNLLHDPLRQMQMVKMVKTVRMKADSEASQSHENCSLFTLPKETQGELSNAGILKCIWTIKDDAMTGGSVVDEVGDEVAHFSVFSLF